MRALAYLCTLSLLLLAGCAGYKLGPTNGTHAGARSVQVMPFQNHTIEPRLIDAVNTALRRGFMQDGTYRLDTQGDATYVLTGDIIRYNREAVAFKPNDVISVVDYYLTMTVHVVATERGTGKVIVDREVTGRATIRVGADQSSAERQAVPIMADDLARKAVSLLADGSW
jgi:hypothetical protein